MFKIDGSKKIVLLAITAAFIGGATVNAMAESQFDKNHPRRAQVNKRLNNQNRRIHNEVKSGQISRSQAHQLHTEDHQVRQEERDMASQNGGHITKLEQGTLNQQENGISKQIGQ